MPKQETDFNRKWRPAVAWTYMVICLFDFLAAPILWSLLQTLYHGSVTIQWDPITLRGAGLFHLSMGAVLGVTAYGRTQEKVAAMPTPATPPDTRARPVQPERPEL